MFRISKLGSIGIVISIIWSYFSLVPDTPTSENAGMVATVVGVAIIFSLILELKDGYKNILRTDVLCILGVYFLTLYEFLFPQPELDRKISPDQAYKGLELILTGLAFLVIGRHLYIRKTNATLSLTKQAGIDLNLLITLYYLCFLLGFLYIFIRVDFNLMTMIDRAMGPRFSQPWSRGRLGGAFVFLSELQLFTYALPPLAGILLNYRKRLSRLNSLMIILILLLTLFMGFAGGTRNIFLSYLIGLIGGFILSMQQISIRKLIFPGVLTLILAYTASTYMFQFRSIGLKRYLQGEREASINEDQVYVDHNLYTLGVIRQTFPSRYEFLGSEVLVWALVKPIPRVLWPDKPEGLSKSMEEIAGAEGYTLASTYIGESYMGGGFTAVIIASLLFGYMSSWWNSRAQFQGESLLIYALGLFVAGITMRSLFMFTTAILPIFGVSVLLQFLRKKT